MATNFTKELIFTPGKKHVKLSKWDPDDTLGWKKDHKMKASLEKCIKRLDELQYLMYAERKHALLIVLQGLDAAGKDGTIRHVMSGVNPQGCRVTSFKMPSVEERSHDFLWRIHKAIPGIGDIGIFQPLAVRRCAGRTRSRPGAQVGMVQALRRNQRFREDADARITFGF